MDGRASREVSWRGQWLEHNSVSEDVGCPEVEVVQNSW